MNYPDRNHNVGVRLTGLALALVLAGCLTPPPKDASPVLNQPVATDLAKTRLGEWPAADWWKRFNDPQLDALIQRALANSPTMAVAQARVEQASAGVGQVAASAGASLGVNGRVTRQQFSSNYIYPPPYAGNYDTGGQTDLNFSYDFDFWGRNASALQAALGQQEAAKADAYAAASSLSAAIAKTYFQWQAIQARMNMVTAIEIKRGQLIELEAQLVKAGIASGDNLHPLAADHAAPSQTLVQLKTQAEQARFTLQALIGDHDAPQLTVETLPDVAGGIPADAHIDLLARRPDVAAARNRVEASLKNVDAARAAFYPDVSISAFLGLNSLSMGNLLHSSSRELGVTPAFNLPLFDAGRLRANLASQRTDVMAAVADYDQAVQNAVADVNSAVVRLDGSLQERDSLVRQHTARQKSEVSATKRMAAGLGTRREVLADQLALLLIDDQEVLRHGAALDAQVDLIKALGGGYGASATVAAAK